MIALNSVTTATIEKFRLHRPDVTLMDLPDACPADEDLTPRKIDAPRLIAAGDAEQRDRGQMPIAEETVKSHVARILGKLGANDRTKAPPSGSESGTLHGKHCYGYKRWRGHAGLSPMGASL
jgi:DNA-binding NarL/FixJ family response regulator